jgi:hypothetical protein
MLHGRSEQPFPFFRRQFMGLQNKARAGLCAESHSSRRCTEPIDNGRWFQFVSKRISPREQRELLRRVPEIV